MEYVNLYHICEFGNILTLTNTLTKLKYSDFCDDYKFEELLAILLLNGDFDFCYKSTILFLHYLKYDNIKSYKNDASVILILKSNLININKIKMFNLFIIFYNILEEKDKLFLEKNGIHTLENYNEITFNTIEDSLTLFYYDRILNTKNMYEKDFELSSFNESTKNPVLLNNLATFYNNKKEYAKAIKYYLLSINTFYTYDNQCFESIMSLFHIYFLNKKPYRENLYKIVLETRSDKSIIDWIILSYRHLETKSEYLKYCNLAISLGYIEYYREIGEFYQIIVAREYEKIKYDFSYQIQKYYLLGYENGDILALEYLINYLIKINKYDEMVKYARLGLNINCNNFVYLWGVFYYSIIKKNEEDILLYLDRIINNADNDDFYNDNDIMEAFDKSYTDLETYKIIKKLKTNFCNSDFLDIFEYYRHRYYYQIVNLIPIEHDNFKTEVLEYLNTNDTINYEEFFNIIIKYMPNIENLSVHEDETWMLSIRDIMND